LRIGVVGAGAAGVELTLAMEHVFSVRTRTGEGVMPELHLFSQSPHVLPTHGALAQKYLLRCLLERGVILHLGERVSDVSGTALITLTGETYPIDVVLWTIAARAPAWLRETDLDLTTDGFIQVNDCLQSVSYEDVFAAGDVATMINHPREKAGVMAVRQGPPLTDNLRRALIRQPLRKFRPQKKWLSLISTGDGRAVASRGRLAAKGAWVWQWKDWIDRRFMTRFGDLPDMTSSPPPPPPGKEEAGVSDAMRCGGCGAKVSSGLLTRVLTRLRNEAPELVLPQTLDDAACVPVPPGEVLWQSVDFFPAFIDDPYVFGQIAANHALGDIYAMGAASKSAQALAVVPFGTAQEMEDDLYLMLAGALRAFRDSATALIGGHSAEGETLALGFAVNGVAAEGAALTKGGMRQGDALIFTKPLGTGALMAANMRGVAKGRWIDAALGLMVQSQAKAADIFLSAHAHACTDITGFGLAGHMVEMMQASGCGAQINLGALPVMEGALDCISAGIVSTLHAENTKAAVHIANVPAQAGHEKYQVLFDPQTAGGLLGAVPFAASGVCLKQLHAAGYVHARIIGQVTALGSNPTLHLIDSA